MPYFVVFLDTKTHRPVVKTVESDRALTATEAVRQAGFDPEGLSMARYNERIDPSTPLIDGDRVEILSPLLIDPMKARALRAQTNPLKKRTSVARHGGKHQLLR